MRAFDLTYAEFNREAGWLRACSPRIAAVVQEEIRKEGRRLAGVLREHVPEQTDWIERAESLARNGSVNAVSTEPKSEGSRMVLAAMLAAV
ncbi:MAG: hypothetical protein U0791_26605 [Gemmataceae bacterium]